MATHPKPHLERYVAGCRCCSCRRFRDRQKPESADKDCMTREELADFMREAKAMGAKWHLAFRLAVNAMLLPLEVVRVKVSDIVDGKPCKLSVDSRGRRRRSRVLVDLDCQTIYALESWLDGLGRRKGRVFGFCGLTFATQFRRCISFARLYKYRPSALRATGIRIRAEAVRSAAQLEHLRHCARLKSYKSLIQYLPKGESEPLALLRGIRWAR